MAFQITESAAEKAKEFLSSQNARYLRVAIKGGGCAGFEYQLQLTNEKEEDDLEFHQHGLDILIDPLSNAYLYTCTLEWKDDMMNVGFHFNNPQAKNRCGCGHSFGV